LQQVDKRPIFVQKLLMMKSKVLENAHGGNGMPMHSQAFLNPGKAFEQNIQAACPKPCKPYL
jgi:hypothetical protein